MNTTALKRIAGFMLVAVGLTIGVSAQVRNDAIKAFNAGVGIMKTDVPAAIDSFERCVEISELVGESADDIKQRAVGVIPGLYFQIAYDIVTAGDDNNGAIQAAKKSLAVAEQYGNTSVEENSKKVLVQGYTTMASGFFSSKENEKAIAAFDSVLMIDPEHLNSIYNKALIYRGLGNTEEFGASIDLYIEKLAATGDSARVDQAKGIATDYFRVEATKANQAEDLEGAVALLTAASKYGPDKNISYLFANVLNKQENFSEAAENALLGLELETGSAEEKAKFYYELAVAQVGMGQTSEACTNFSNASYGDFAEASEAQRTNLKCQ